MQPSPPHQTRKNGLPFFFRDFDFRLFPVFFQILKEDGKNGNVFLKAGCDMSPKPPTLLLKHAQRKFIVG